MPDVEGVNRKYTPNPVKSRPKTPNPPGSPQEIGHTFETRPIDREHHPPGEGPMEQEDENLEKETAAPSEAELAYTMREVELAVEEINRRMVQLNKPIHLEIIETPSGVAVHITDREMTSALNQKDWEATRRIRPEEALKWVNRLQQGEGLIIDDQA